MNSASNRMAKWYQNAIIASLLLGIASCRICAMPTARVGAPPARCRMVGSPIAAAVAVSCSGVMVKPQVLVM
ncbi:hypothetical protein D3C81_1891110 [compost metagenome]